MVMEMFVLRILNLINAPLTSHSVYEFLEIEQNGKKAMEAYEAIVMGRVL